MPVYGYLRDHGYGFQTESDHRQSECLWCRQAKEVAVSHMRDTTLKSTKSTKYEPDDTPHTVHLTRQGREHGPAMYSEHPMYGTCTTGLFGSTLGTAPLATQINFTDEEKRRPVVLDLTEAEAATVVKLLDREEATQSEEAEVHYQNGDGFEEQCADARTLAAEAETIANRLRTVLGKHLDKMYGGELGS